MIRLRQSLLGLRTGREGVRRVPRGRGHILQYPKYDQFPAFARCSAAIENGGHPWAPNETYTVKVDDPEDPSTRLSREGLRDPGRSVPVRDGYSREKLHILLSVDTDQTDMGPKRRFLPERARTEISA